MRLLLTEICERIVDLWDTGNFYIRLALVLVLGWPVLMILVVLAWLRGDAAVALALIPAVALVLLLLVIPPMLPVLVLVIPSQPFRFLPILDRFRLPTRAERLRALKRALKFLTLVAGIESAISIYFAGVPVWKDPGLILWLLAFTIIFVLMWFGGVRHKWLTRSFVIVFLVITTIFFLGGREEIRGWKEKREGRKVEQLAAAQVEWAPKEFTLNAGEEGLTVVVGPGTIHRIKASKPWVAVVRADGKDYPMPAGSSSWRGGVPKGLLIVRGVEDGTTLRFERAQ